MKKWIYGFFLLALLAGGLVVWQNKKPQVPPVSPDTAPSAQKEVAASGYVVYDLARRIGGDKINLTLLVPPGAEPHHFEPTPGTIISINKADLFVYVSAELEPWTQDILKGLARVKALAAGPVFEGEDPHVWITPYGALSMAKVIAQALEETDPAHKKYYRENLKSFEEEIALLHADFKQALAICQTREMVHIGHLAFGALAQDYQLNLHALTGTSHQSEHSVKKIADLVKLIKKNKVTAVFTEEFLSPELAQMISAEAGVKVLPLYTVQGLGKDDFEQGKTYIDFMRQNLDSLQKGLVCQAQ